MLSCSNSPGRNSDVWTGTTANVSRLPVVNLKRMINIHVPFVTIGSKFLVMQLAPNSKIYKTGIASFLACHSSRKRRTYSKISSPVHKDSAILSGHIPTPSCRRPKRSRLKDFTFARSKAPTSYSPLKPISFAKNYTSGLRFARSRLPFSRYLFPHESRDRRNSRN